MTRQAFIIGGPTASGKSSFAVRLAQALDGVVINGDSMQLYADLSVLTARPSRLVMDEVPHGLYGILGAHQSNSVWGWMHEVESFFKTTTKAPIIVGGTGMYLNALLNGVVELPDISVDARDKAQSLYDVVGEVRFRKELAQHDPVSSRVIKPGDRQRLIRAWCVVTQTGKSLPDWQCDPQWKPEGMHYTKILISPPREKLYATCDQRLLEMIREGALDEVKVLMDMDLDPNLPLMKAIGVEEFSAYLRGQVSLEKALDKAQQLTRNYVKRQLTWFRNKFSPDILITDPQRVEVEEIICHTNGFLQ